MKANPRPPGTRDRLRTGCFALVVALGTVPGVLAAQAGGPEPSSAERFPLDPESAPRPSIQARAMTGDLILDGVPDEAFWATADSATDFITTLPRAGFPASERTVVRVLFDETHLYISGVMYDSAPERLYSPGLEQDFETNAADMFGISIDSYLDRQNGVMFGVSPAGALFDAQMEGDSRYINRSWEGVVHVATHVADDRWSAELAIPFTTLRFEASELDQTWGINFLRRVRRINEDSYWAPLASQFRLHKMSRAGMLTGLGGLRHGRNLTLKPYVSAASVSGTAPRGLGLDGEDLDVGLDIKYGLTSRLTLDVTALTDFSQVEVDQEQVNLTRFSLFFPEKRDFFLENDGIFTLGDVTERNYRTGSSPRDFKLFYSRAVGLSADRRLIPIAGGARLSGRVGRTEVGLLNMQTRSLGSLGGSAFTPAENFTVFRIRQPLLGSSDIGMMLVNRQATGEGAGGDFNRSLGLDANFRLFRYLLVNSYLAATDEPDVSGDRGSGYLQLAWRDPLWNASAFVKHVGESFNPGVGFIRRNGIRQAFATLGVHPQPSGDAIQEINPYVDVSAIENLNGVLETRWVTGGLATQFADGGRVVAEAQDRFERLLEDTPIAGVPVPAGDYGFRDASVSYTSSGARRLSGSVTVSRGSFYDGDRTSYEGSVLLRPNTSWALDLFGQHNQLELAGESFTADVFGGRVKYAHSTRLFLSGFLQYLEASDELVTNVRLNFLHAPLSDLFLVYTDRRDLGGDLVVDRRLTLKATRLLSF